MATVLVSAGMWLSPNLPAKKGGELVTAERANTKKERRTGHQCGIDPYFCFWSVEGLLFLWAQPTWITQRKPSSGTCSSQQSHSQSFWWRPLFSKEGISGRVPGSMSLSNSHTALPRTGKDAWWLLRAGFAGALPGVSPGVVLGRDESHQAALDRVSPHLEVWSLRSSSEAPPPLGFSCAKYC